MHCIVVQLIPPNDCPWEKELSMLLCAAVWDYVAPVVVSCVIIHWIFNYEVFSSCWTAGTSAGLLSHMVLVPRLTLNVLNHTVPHELKSSEQHNQKQFKKFCLITFFEKLELVLRASSIDKGIANI